MTYLTDNFVIDHGQDVMDASYMAVVDEAGQETPITELDIRRTLKQLSEADNLPENIHESADDAFDTLMLAAEAARAVS